MKIKYIHIKNFKSFGEQIINLENLTILLGANASGKSNTVSIIRFVNNIILYGLDDAISLLGGINYAINATIGKNESMYLKFILDLHDEEWIRIVNQKEGKGLLLEEIVSEFEIIPYKRGMGYKIGAERLEIKYTTYTDYITKEKFNQMIPSKIDRINIMIEILKKYNLNEAILRNKSLKYFWEYISHIEEMTVL